MTIQLPCLRKDIAAFPFNVAFIWGGMSYMVIGGVALGCTEYQTRSHNVVGIIENRFVWTIESHCHIKGHLWGASQEKVPSNLVILSFKWHGKYDYNYSTIYQVPYGDWWTLLI